MSKGKSGSTIPKHLIVVGGVLIVLAIVFVVLILTQDEPVVPNNQVNEIGSSENNENTNTNTNTNTTNNNGIFDPLRDPIETVTNLDSAIATTAGSNLITQDGKVVNDIGQVVKNNALPMSPIAPKLSEPVDPNSLIEGVTRLTANESGFTPAEFTVVTGEPVTLSLTSIGVGSRLVFKDVALIALELPVPADYTMAKTFNAPAPGEYIFYQDMPGRINQTGKMIVVDRQ